MVSILLVAHTPLASAFLEVAQHIFKQKPPQLAAIDILADEPHAMVARKIEQSLQQFNEENTQNQAENRGDTEDRLPLEPKQILIMTDIAGATPANICGHELKYDKNSPVVIVSGLSVPMLLRAITYRHLPLMEVAHKSIEGAQHGALILHTGT